MLSLTEGQHHRHSICTPLQACHVGLRRRSIDQASTNTQTRSRYYGGHRCCRRSNLLRLIDSGAVRLLLVAVSIGGVRISRLVILARTEVLAQEYCQPEHLPLASAPLRTLTQECTVMTDACMHAPFVTDGMSMVLSAAASQDHALHAVFCVTTHTL